MATAREKEIDAVLARAAEKYKLTPIKNEPLPICKPKRLVTSRVLALEAEGYTVRTSFGKGIIYVIDGDNKIYRALKTDKYSPRRLFEVNELATYEAARDLVYKIAEEHEITVNSLLSKSRNIKIVTARNAAIKAVHKLMSHWSVVDLGVFFNLNHTTILYNLNRRKNRKCKLNLDKSDQI